MNGASAEELRAQAARAADVDLLRPPGKRLLLPNDQAAAIAVVKTLNTGGWNAELARLATKLAAATLGLAIHMLTPAGGVESAGSGSAAHLVELASPAVRYAAARPKPAQRNQG